MPRASPVQVMEPSYGLLVGSLPQRTHPRRSTTMPMIDVYATAGTFGDKHRLAVDLAAKLM